MVAPRLHARCSAQRPDSALGLPLDEGSTHDVTQQSAQRPWSRMNRRTLLFQTALSLAACPCCVAPASAAGDAWDYGPNGPSSWPGTCKVRMLCCARSKLCVGSIARLQASQTDGQELYGHSQRSNKPAIYVLLQAGQAQSPIDIPTKGRTGSAAAGQRGDLDLEYSQTSAAGQRGELHMQYSTSSAAGQRGELNIHYGDLNLQYSQPSAAGGRGDLNLTYSQSSAAGGTGDLKLKYSQKQVGELELQYSQTSGATVKNTGHGALQVRPSQTAVRCWLPPATACSQLSTHVTAARWQCCFDWQLLVQGVAADAEQDALIVQVNVPKGNYCMLDGQKLELVQYHFHTPSEHTLDGAGTAMEAHLVHKNVSTGQCAKRTALCNSPSCVSCVLPKSWCVLTGCIRLEAG